jgi:hypothetical protein
MDAVSVTAEAQSRRWRWPLLEQLPDLKGRWLTFYTILWAIMLPLAIIGPVHGAYLFYGWHMKPAWIPYGLAIRDDPRAVRLAAVASADVTRAGAHAGERIVAIDGWRLPASSAASTMARDHLIKREGASTDFTLMSARGTEHDVRLTFSRRHIDERYYGTGLSFAAEAAILIGSNLFTALSLVGAALLLFIRQRREAVPAFLSLGFLLVSASNFVADWRDIGVPNVIAALVGLTGWSFLLCALFAFPSGRFEPRWTGAAAMALLLFIVEPAVRFSNNLIFSTLAAFIVLAAIALVARYRRLEPGAERQQLRWVFLGFVVGALMLMFAIAGLLLSWQIEGADARWDVWDVFGNLVAAGGVFFITLGLSVSILRFRLYDADAVIGRSAAFAMLTLGFVVLFTASEKLIELLGQMYLGQNMGSLAGGIGAALAAVAIAPMHARAQRWAERKFQRPLYQLRHGLPPLVGDLRETSGLDRIAAATLDSLVEGVRTRAAALVVGGKLIDAREIRTDEVEQWRARWLPPAHDGIDLDKRDRLFPMRVPLEAEGHGRVGWLLLGPRPDGSLFGKAECAAIEEITEPVARAVQVALLRQGREERYERRFEALETLVAQLRKQPSAV